jgi:hypothetical protein
LTGRKKRVKYNPASKREQEKSERARAKKEVKKNSKKALDRRKKK